MGKPNLQVIITSTRPGRVGPAVARWFYDIARQREDLDVELVDLADFDLPVFNEPHQPIEGDYVFEPTKRWAASVRRADAFVFVMPEYNHSFSAGTKNALDYLYTEWRSKPTGLVSYGGSAMGTRAVQAIKPVLAALKLVYAGEVNIALKVAPVTEGVFHATTTLEATARALVREVATLTPTYRLLRNQE